MINDRQSTKDFMPMAIPEDLSERLIHLHGHPFVWFIGQLIKYLLRPQPWLNELVEKQYQKIQFQRPIVGYVANRFNRTSSISEFLEFMFEELINEVKPRFIIYQNT